MHKAQPLTKAPVSKVGEGFERSLTQTTAKANGAAKFGKVVSQKQLMPVKIDFKLVMTKASTQSSKVLPMPDKDAAKVKQEKLEKAIEEKFGQSSMKRYRFPKREMEEDLCPDDSLCSLREVCVYDLHSQNKRASPLLPSSRKSTVPKQASPEIFKPLFPAEYSSSKLVMNFKGLRSTRETLQGHSTDRLNSLLKKLSIQKGRLREYSNSTGKGGPKENKTGLAIKKQSFAKCIPAEKHELVLKYLRVSRAKIENYKQKYLPGLSKQSLLEVRYSTHSKGMQGKERNSSISTKSFGKIMNDRQETSTNKFKQLKLSCLGSFTQSPETKIKNSKSFLFGESAGSGIWNKEQSTEAYNLKKNTGLEKQIFEIPLSSLKEPSLSVAGLQLQPQKSGNSVYYQVNKGKSGGFTDRLHYRSLVD
jgi:hypothetical protein